MLEETLNKLEKLRSPAFCQTMTEQMNLCRQYMAEQNFDASAEVIKTLYNELGLSNLDENQLSSIFELMNRRTQDMLGKISYGAQVGFIQSHPEILFPKLDPRKPYVLSLLKLTDEWVKNANHYIDKMQNEKQTSENMAELMLKQIDQYKSIDNILAFLENPSGLKPLGTKFNYQKPPEEPTMN